MVVITRRLPKGGPEGTIKGIYYADKLDALLQGFKKAIDYKNTSVVIVVDGRSGMGKCLKKGSKVLMSNGEWKKVEDVKKGDEVISPQQDGSFIVSKVIGTHNRFEEEMYDVYESGRHNKLLYSCAWNHDIPFFRTESRRLKNGKRSYKKILDVKEARDLSKNSKTYATSFSTSAVDYGNKDIKLDPYVLGVYLGEGTFSLCHSNPMISKTNKDIVNYINNLYPIMNTYHNKDHTFSLYNQLSQELIKLGLKGKTSEHKFIPRHALLGSINYRMNLLAGLIDTDGYVNKDNAIIYTTKSKQLAEDIYNLVFSLGGHSNVREIWKKCTGWKEKKKYYDVKISFKDPTIIPLKTDKKKRLSKMINDPTHIRIKVIRSKPAEIYGIEIDSPSKWHITDNWMVTHNTCLANQLGIYLDPKFNLEKILYTPQEFMEALAVAKKGDFLLFDEAMLLSNRSAMSSINKMIIQAMSMIRSKNIYVCFCVNSIFDLDKNLSLHRADILFHVYGDNLIDRGKYAAFFKVKAGEDRLKKLYLFGKKWYSYSQPKANFISRFVNEFVVDEEEYEKRKQIGVNKFLQGVEKKEGVREKKHKVWVSNLIEYIIEQGWMKSKEIAKVTGISERELAIFRAEIRARTQENAKCKTQQIAY